MPAGTFRERIGKKRPFEAVEQEAALMMLYVADRIENRFGRLFREYGLTNSQYNVLRILQGEGKPLPALEIAKRMIQVVPAITGLIDRLEKQQLVTRRRCEDDRRIIHIELTRAGKSVLAKIEKPLGSLHRELLGHMSKRDLTNLKNLLEKSAERLED